MACRVEDSRSRMRVAGRAMLAGLLLASVGRAFAQDAPPVATGLAPYFTVATPGAKAPDADGFLQPGC